MKNTKIIYVKCTFTLPVEVPDNKFPENKDYDEYFDIEENHCIGTGNVGAALDKRIKEFDEKHFCWACGISERCEIVSPPLED